MHKGGHASKAEGQQALVHQVVEKIQALDMQ